MEQYLEVLQPTPLKPIKAVELLKKWGPLLPKYSRLITCPKSINERNLNKTLERTKIKRGKETDT